MRIFAIKDDTLSREIVLGYLIYYENAKAFYIELPDDADPAESTGDSPMMTVNLQSIGPAYLP